MAEVGEIRVKVKLETESGDAFDVQRLRLEPGDVLVFKSHRSLDSDSARRLKALAEEVFVGHEVIVLSEIDLEIAKPAAAE